jgi:hypothetical protein
VNARARWTGHLFQGRFSSVALDEEHLDAGGAVCADAGANTAAGRVEARTIAAQPKAAEAFEADVDVAVACGDSQRPEIDVGVAAGYGVELVHEELPGR